MVANCRSSHDLAQHLSDRLSSEASDDGLSSLSRKEALVQQMMSLRQEFQQLELMARTRETNLRDDR